MEKGILTKEMEVKLAGWLDDLIKLSAPLEAIDGIVFRIAITAIDNKYGELIPEPYKSELREGLGYVFIEEDYEKAIAAGFKLIDKLVDIPGIDDETEAMIFTGLMQVVIALLAKNKA